ncbi:MAG TPA: TonB-dependent receptor [Rhizomicrobium sp.]|nr:TonB-dependent receptor [Rhizomicrobium sp.]
MKSSSIRRLLLASAVFASGIGAASAQDFNVPAGDLKLALDAYSAQTGTPLIYPAEAVRGIRTGGAKGPLSAGDALSRILSGTGFGIHREGSAVAIVRQQQSEAPQITPMQMAQAAPSARASVETVTVTSSKLGGADVQSIPIAITALSQEQLTATQTAGGPDLVKQVPNLTFTKTNFTGYSIQIRGIGTQAVSVTTDPAVAVAMNDIPFIRNHFFEQEFYDLGQVEVLRGPQGTLYGRNATAGVVNLITAKPTDQFEAMASGEIGNYHQRRFEGMINLPIVDDRLDVRLAGEWTKRQGYSFNSLTNERIDGRDLWSGRLSVGWKPIENLQAHFVWEHFAENDDRMRTAKQLCKTAHSPTEVLGVPVTAGYGIQAYNDQNYLNQACLPASFYSDEAFQVPNGTVLPYYEPLSPKGPPIMSVGMQFDPYLNTTQSQNLRVIESALNPVYKAKNDTVEFNADYDLSPTLTATSQTGFSEDFLWSAEDYNRFNTRPGAFAYQPPDPTDYFNYNKFGQLTRDPSGLGICTRDGSVCGNQGDSCTPEEPIQSPLYQACVPIGVFCDPQLGCSNRLVAEDLSEERSWQLSQEFRLASHFAGPLNFSIGGNYLHYETAENYYVFINSLTLAAYSWTKGTGGQPYQSLPWMPGVSDNSNCLQGGFVNTNPKVPTDIGAIGGAPGHDECMYIDPNPISSLNNQGHNYFLSQNPYTLNSYALFGEAYYNLTDDLKLTGGLRWTDDQKHFTDIPSELLVYGYGYPVTGTVDQQWKEFTGRFAANWSPKLDFTDQTLFYASFSHGYKAGGANPPGAILLTFGSSVVANPIHPLTFRPEFINAYEVGTKNTLLDGAMTLNGSAFFYDYKDYQISRIVDRTAINDNFNATVRGAELEATYEPLPGLRFNFAGGYENTRLDNGTKSVDLIDRADLANHPDWMVVKPFPTQASNCILPLYVVAAVMAKSPSSAPPNSINGACASAYTSGVDPVTQQTYQYGVDNGLYPVAINYGPSSTISYQGFNPATAPNNGQGFDKDLSGNELPNSPPFTISAGAQYSMPLTTDWAGTIRADYYWQDYSWARVFNDKPYDRLRGYTNVNLALILTSQAGWQVMLYDKNVFNTTDITGAFLNSDDSGLTTNVFLTDPKLIGIRVTKNW